MCCRSSRRHQSRWYVICVGKNLFEIFDGGVVVQDIPAGVMRKVRSHAPAPGGSASSEISASGKVPEEKLPKHLVKGPAGRHEARSRGQSKCFKLATQSLHARKLSPPMREDTCVSISLDRHLGPA